jgi:hypothetical protein
MASMPDSERPFLTARWTELLLLNFPVPADVIARLAPLGTEPDLFQGQTYVSIVGFKFRDTRVRGCAVPGHTHFLEINLRYYVRRVVDGQVRHGVVFVREIVPRRLIAAVANRLFHEHYVCRPMRCDTSENRLAYAWRSNARWNTLAARVAAPYCLSPPNSFEAFIVEHYWGYTTGRDGVTREYRVAHDSWRVAPADNVIWDCDVAATYNTPLADYLMSPPTTALIADGGAVEIFPGHRLTSPSRARRGPA